MYDRSLNRFSNHARIRARQRGCRRAGLDLMMNYADIELPVGQGCISVQISNRMAVYLRDAGLRPSSIDEARRTIAVLSPDGTLVTLLKRSPSSGHRGRSRRPRSSRQRYARQSASRSKMPRDTDDWK